MEDKSIAYVLQRRRYAVAIMMLWFFNEQNLPERYRQELEELSAHTQTVVATDDYHWLREQNLAARCPPHL